MTHGGGFTGLVISSSVDSAALAPDDADALRAKVDQADLASLADLVPATDGQVAPDSGQYQLTVEDERGSRTVVLPERDLPAGARSLIDWVQSAPGREDRVEPPG